MEFIFIVTNYNNNKKKKKKKKKNRKLPHIRLHSCENELKKSIQQRRNETGSVFFRRFLNALVKRGGKKKPNIHSSEIHAKFPPEVLGP